MKTGIAICLCTGMVLIVSCSRSNNLLLGRVEAMVGANRVVVTDCYRTSEPQPQKIEGDPTGKAIYRFTPCKDADVLIHGDQVTVNGRFYGSIGPGDEVVVDHGVVSINKGGAQANKR